jgi:hypothetical protein
MVNARKTSEPETRRIATSADFEAYFEINTAAPGTGPWREAIDHLVQEISTDLESTTLSQQEASDLIGSLLAVREIVETAGGQQKDES